VVWQFMVKGIGFQATVLEGRGDSGCDMVAGDGPWWSENKREEKGNGG